MNGRDTRSTLPGPVHFIWLGGEWLWQHDRAVETAAVHDAPIWLHGERGDLARLPASVLAQVTPRKLILPRWLRYHSIGLANVKDLYAWQILRANGGLYLDLDTISLRPVWGLLKHDVLVSREWENEADGVHQYNSAVVAARQGADVLAYLERRTYQLLKAGESRWGACGPHLLTEVVAEQPKAFDVAPFGVLNGFRDDTVEAEYYDLLPQPRVPENARVLHLYSSSRPAKFAADRWMPGVAVPEKTG